MPQTFCDRYGTDFYDLKTPEEKSSAPFSKDSKDFARRPLAAIEGVHPATVQGRSIAPVRRPKPPIRKFITGVSTQNVELDGLYSFAGEKHADEQESDLEEVGKYWTRIAMARESRLMLEVVVGPRTQESRQDRWRARARAARS